MGERGQTTQDFAVGVSVLLVTIIGAFVFSQGGALGVYEGGSPGVEQPQADRIASYVVENYSAENQPNVLRYDNPGDGDIDDLPSSGELSDLKLRAGVNVSSDRRADPIVNVSIVSNETLQNGERTPARDGGVLAWGDSRRAESTTSSRVVQLEGTSDDICDPVCWLVVRVW